MVVLSFCSTKVRKHGIQLCLCWQYAVQAVCIYVVYEVNGYKQIITIIVSVNINWRDVQRRNIVNNVDM